MSLILYFHVKISIKREREIRMEEGQNFSGRGGGGIQESRSRGKYGWNVSSSFHAS